MPPLKSWPDSQVVAEKVIPCQLLFCPDLQAKKQNVDIAGPRRQVGLNAAVRGLRLYRNLNCWIWVYLLERFSGQTVKPARLPADHNSRSKVAKVICVSSVSCQRTAEARCTAS